MSNKKVVTKSKAQPAPATENGTPAPAAATTDVRVAHQLRVLETVAAGQGEEDEKKYSPRTEKHIQQLTGVLDFYEYSRSDIAALVRRCHYDENQIQIAVANIIEDRANHEKEEWGTVKNKKQTKEEKKIKEEEKKEQERLEKEAEKHRKEAERKAAKEAREAERANKRSGKGGKNGMDADVGASALPPDPAILFAGTKPTQNVESDQGASQGNWQGQWWEGSGDKWNGKNWEWQQESWPEEWVENKNGGKSGNSWEWQGQEWSEDWGGNKEGNEWWGSGWEKAGKKKKGYKEKKDGPALEEEETEGDFWDMPDTSAPDGEGGLDRWTLGRLPGHETEDQGVAVPKAMPNNALTVEALERDHLAAAPTIAPQVAAPVPMNAPSGNWMVDGLPPPPQQDLLAALGGAPVAASSSSAPAEERPQERSERGEKGEKGDKGKGKGKKGKDREKGEGEKERLERIDRSDDPRRQAVEQVGEVVTVRKHSSMGCAVVSMTDTRVRQAIVAEGNECTINGLKVQIKPHHNKETKEEVMTDLFVAWGRQVEKVNPLSEQMIAKYFDGKYKEIIAGWKAAEEERRQAEELEQQRAQEQQRQELVLKQRTEERRRYEVEEEQKRRQEAEQQQKWISQQWMQQAAGGVVPQGGTLRASADAYTAQLQQQQPQQQAAAMQWNNSQQQQWMQAMAYQAQNWQMAQRGLQMQGMTASGQDQDWRAYYQQYLDQQQRGQSAFAAQQQSGGYQNQQTFNYGAAYSRGERI